ncbi:MAG TPA: hypothetical protein VGR96_12450, partial [Acidobacteriaceae bacterium]|nr:hypothetical protein [Acidobacteriaceae bacterium]
IPTRDGNGAMETLARDGEFAPPSLALLEAAAVYGVKLGRGRVFTDLWDVERLSGCPLCREPRVSRLREMNLRQSIPPPVACPNCEPCH